MVVCRARQRSRAAPGCRAAQRSDADRGEPRGGERSDRVGRDVAGLDGCGSKAPARASGRATRLSTRRGCSTGRLYRAAAVNGASRATAATATTARVMPAAVPGVTLAVLRTSRDGPRRCRSQVGHETSRGHCFSPARWPIARPPARAPGSASLLLSRGCPPGRYRARERHPRPWRSRGGRS